MRNNRELVWFMTMLKKPKVIFIESKLNLCSTSWIGEVIRTSLTEVENLEV